MTARDVTSGEDAQPSQRYSVIRRCVCTPEERGNGWGCCCSRPKVVVEDDDGEFILVPRNGSEAQ